MIKRGRLNQAVPKLEACVERMPTLIAARQMLAELYANVGRNQEAIEQQQILLELQEQ